MIYAELDNFNVYNDRYGFLRGDEALLETAALLTEAVAETLSYPRSSGTSAAMTSP